LEWEAHRQAKDRIVQLFVSNGWESEQEVPTPVKSLIDGVVHPYVCDVIGVKRNAKTGEASKRVIVEIDSIHVGSKTGHKSFLAYRHDLARGREIVSHFYRKYDNRRKITTLKRFYTADIVGRYKQPDDVIKLELGILELKDWNWEPTAVERMQRPL